MSSFTPINARQVEEKKRAQARQCYWCVVSESLEEPCKHQDTPNEQGCCDDYEIKRSKEEEAAFKAETEDTEAETEDTVNAETQDTINAETEDTVNAETKDTIDAETQDTVDAETEDTTDAETEDTTDAEMEDTDAETEDTVDTETEDTTDAQTEDTDAETEDTVDAQTEDTIDAEPETPVQPAAERPIVEERARGKANNMKTCSRCNGKEYNMSNFADHNKVHVLEENGVQARYPCKCCKAGNCVVAQRPTSIQTYSCLSCLRSHRKCSFNGLKTAPRERCRPGLHPALLRQMA